MRFLHLIRPVMCVLPEVASPDRKVSFEAALVIGHVCIKIGSSLMEQHCHCHPMSLAFVFLTLFFSNLFEMLTSY